MKPYFEANGVTLYCGDCAEWIECGLWFGIGAIVTDPPYGIGAGRMNLGKWRTSKMRKSDWDSEAPDLSPLLGLGVPTIIWGGNYFPLPPSRCFLVWDKGAGFKGRDFSECETAWTNLDAVARIFRYDPLAGGDYRTKTHPTQKPVRLMEWCLSFVPTDDVILDPYAGSATTGVACIRQGLKFIGIERDEGFCEAAAKRLERTIADRKSELPFEASA